MTRLGNPRTNVYVRNDPVNWIDPDGRLARAPELMPPVDWYNWNWWDPPPFNYWNVDPVDGGPWSGGNGESQQDQIDRILKTINTIAEKKDCAGFLGGIFDYASIEGVTSLAQNANYHIASLGDTTITPGGVNVGKKLAVPASGTYTKAFVERGQNVVYVGQGAFGGNLGTTLLHEALHISYYDPSTQIFVGFGLSDSELATAVGAFKEGMTNEQASLAFSE
jgi:hypothetical protein